MSETAGVKALPPFWAFLFQIQVEIKSRQLCLCRPRPRAVAERDEAEARRQHHCLLRPGDERVDAPFVHRDFFDADGGHAVDDEQRPAFGEPRDLLDRMPGRGRGLARLDHHRLDVAMFF